jgi:hypothetical protein
MEILAIYADGTAYEPVGLENMELLIKKQNLLSEANCSLSFKILDFQNQNAKLNDEKKILARFSTDVIYNAMERTGGNSSNADGLSKILGTTTEKYKAVQSLISEKGYK